MKKNNDKSDIETLETGTSICRLTYVAAVETENRSKSNKNAIARPNIYFTTSNTARSETSKRKFAGTLRTDECRAATFCLCTVIESIIESSGFVGGQWRQCVKVVVKRYDTVYITLNLQYTVDCGIHARLPRSKLEWTSLKVCHERYTVVGQNRQRYSPSLSR